MNRVVPNGTLRGVEGEGKISPIRLPSYTESLPVAGFLYCGSEGDIMEQSTVPYCFLLAGRLAYAPWGALWRKVFGVVPIMRLNSRVK